MYVLVALVSCVAVASASQCCVPPQWEGRTGFLTTIARGTDVKISRGTASMAYDGVNYRMGQYYSIELDGKSSQEYGVLMDYKANAKYIVNNGKCIRTVLNRTVEDFGGCIPDNATIGSNNVLGFGTNDLSMNSYKLEYPGVTSYIALTSSGCVPVMEVTRGTLDGVNFLQNTHYFNITAGIADLSVLASPPKGCESAELVSAHFSAGTAFIGKRSSFFGF